MRKISQELDHLEPERARYVASFAYILSRVAHADLEITVQEMAAMRRFVRDLGGLSDAEAAIVVDIAKNQTLQFGSTENYVVTREFTSLATPEEKIALIECLFAVAAADQEVSNEEEREIRRIAGELGLTHADFIGARTKFREYIAVLRREGER